MARDPKHDILFEPIQIGPKTLRNRFYQVPHCIGAGSDKPGFQAAHRSMKAQGGWAAMNTEYCSIHPESDDTHRLSARLWDEGDVRNLRAMTEEIHKYGALAGVEMWYGGAHAPCMESRATPRGPSQYASEFETLTYCKEMDLNDIKMVQQYYVDAAYRARDAGFDIVYVYGAHAYLPLQFLNPYYNKRTDGYGGSVENRTRFLREIIAAMRAEVGPTFPIGVRLSSSEEVQGGLTPDQCAEIALIVEPLVDFIDVSLAGYYKFYRMLAPMDEPLGYELPKSELVTRSLRVPTIVTGRIMTLDHASQIVGSGQADMVSLVRALVADPELVRKAREGHANEVRPCIGSSQGCLGGLFSPKLGMQPKMGCVVNVAAGIEDMMPSDTPTRATRTKRVVIVGGGAAGMEAARTAALRGHDVTLYEMTSKLGGQVAIAAQAPHRGDYGAITRWLADEMERLGVKVLLRTAADPDLLAEDGADEIIIATGSTPRRDGFQAGEPGRSLEGGGLAHVYTSWDVFGFGGRATIGTSALVYDDTGEYEAVCVAEALIEAGAHVTFVTRHGRIGEHVPAPEGTLLPALERLRSSDFTCVTGSFIERITPDEVQVGVLGGTKSTTHKADTVVMVGYNHPNRELADAMVATGGRTHLVGDAAGGVGLQKAIKEGHMAARLL